MKGWTAGKGLGDEPACSRTMAMRSGRVGGKEAEIRFLGRRMLRAESDVRRTERFKARPRARRSQGDPSGLLAPLLHFQNFQFRSTIQRSVFFRGVGDPRTGFAVAFGGNSVRGNSLLDEEVFHGFGTAFT